MPAMFEIPLMSKSMLRLWAEKATLKSVAEKLEFAMHGLRERDSILRVSAAAAKGTAAAASHSRAFAGEKTMVDGRLVYYAPGAAARGYSRRVQRRGWAKPAAATEGRAKDGWPAGRGRREASEGASGGGWRREW